MPAETLNNTTNTNINLNTPKFDQQFSDLTSTAPFPDFGGQDVKDEDEDNKAPITPDVESKEAEADVDKPEIKPLDDKLKGPEELQKLQSKNKEVDEKSKPIRDLTGFGEREAKMLQRMPYEAYEYFSKQIKDARALEAKTAELEKNYKAETAKLKEGKTELPESYYDNPQSIYLTPDIQQVQSSINLSSQIEAHWKNQIINIETGKDWYDLIEDPKTGQIYVASKPSDCGTIGSEEWIKNKLQVAEYYNNVQQQTSGYRGQLNNMVSNFKSRHEGIMNNIKQSEDKYMPMFADKNSEEYKKVTMVEAEIPKLGINKHNPAFGLLSKSIALNLLLKEAIAEITKQEKTTTSVAADVKKAGPTAGTFSGSGSTKSIKAPSLKDFESLGLPRINL